MPKGNVAPLGWPGPRISFAGLPLAAPRPTHADAAESHHRMSESLSPRSSAHAPHGQPSLECLGAANPQKRTSARAADRSNESRAIPYFGLAALQSTSPSCGRIPGPPPAMREGGAIRHERMNMMGLLALCCGECFDSGHGECFDSGHDQRCRAEMQSREQQSRRSRAPVPNAASSSHSTAGLSDFSSQANHTLRELRFEHSLVSWLQQGDAGSDLEVLTRRPSRQ